MLGLMDADVRARELAERVKALESSAGDRQIALDPKRVRVSRFANRNEASFATAEFEELRQSIRATKGNQVPVIVRPVEGDPKADFEVVYGHRRRQACLDVGCALQAIVQPLGDLELFLLMSTENFFREDLSPYEAGCTYGLAIREGLFATQTQLAEHLGKTAAHVSQSIRVADLPAEVVGAFSSPLEIQVRWAIALHSELERDSAGVLGRARELAADREGRSAAETFRTLLPRAKSSKTKVLPVVVKGKSLGTIEVARNGAVGIRLSRGVVKAERLPDLQKLLATFLKPD
jgi:ParB family chromosome partitioning protein